MPKASFAAAAALAIAGSALADQVTIGALKDTTLYEDAGGQFGNGSGQFFFAGTTAGGELRRGLLAFDIASAIPAGSVITGATLTLHMSRTVSGDQPVSLHRALNNWGEGDSDASGQEGIGDVAAANDATWIHTFYPGSQWDNAGGDYAPGASATTMVGEAFFYYSWSGAGVVADIQHWLDNPADDFGWALVGDESILASAKRFDSTENPSVELRPSLTIDYLIPAPGAGALLGLAALAAARRRR